MRFFKCGKVYLSCEAVDEEGAEQDEPGRGEEEAEVEGAVERGVPDHSDLRSEEYFQHW